MKGIGEKTAINFLIEMGEDIKQFETHKKLIAMAGFDPGPRNFFGSDGNVGRLLSRDSRTSNPNPDDQLIHISLAVT